MSILDLQGLSTADRPAHGDDEDGGLEIVVSIICLLSTICED